MGTKRAAVPLMHESSRWSLKHLSCMVLWTLGAEQQRVSAMSYSLPELGVLQSMSVELGTVTGPLKTGKRKGRKRG